MFRCVNFTDGITVHLPVGAVTQQTDAIPDTLQQAPPPRATLYSHVIFRITSNDRNQVCWSTSIYSFADHLFVPSSLPFNNFHTGYVQSLSLLYMNLIIFCVIDS